MAEPRFIIIKCGSAIAMATTTSFKTKKKHDKTIWTCKRFIWNRSVIYVTFLLQAQVSHTGLFVSNSQPQKWLNIETVFLCYKTLTKWFVQYVVILLVDQIKTPLFDDWSSTKGSKHIATSTWKMDKRYKTISSSLMIRKRAILWSGKITHIETIYGQSLGWDSKSFLWDECASHDTLSYKSFVWWPSIQITQYKSGVGK